jgi:hypothetical protein
MDMKYAINVSLDMIWNMENAQENVLIIIAMIAQMIQEFVKNVNQVENYLMEFVEKKV